VLGGVIAGLGHGLTFRAGLAAVNAGAPPAQRGEAASSFFVVMYVAISLPVIGAGLLTEATGLRPAGLIFAAAVAALAAVALVVPWRQRRSRRRRARRRPSVTHGRPAEELR